LRLELGLGLGLGLGHLEFRCGETAEWVAWHQATHGAEEAEPDVPVRVAAQA